MNLKKNLVLSMFYGKYIAFILATIFVVVSQIVGEAIWVVLALSLYTVGFAFMFISLVVHAVEIYDADKVVKEDNLKVLDADEATVESVAINGENVKSKDVEVVSLKKEKIWTVVGSIFFGIFTAFTFAVLLLYSIQYF